MKRNRRKPNSEALPSPPYLSGDEAQIWRETVAHLQEAGELLAADTPTIETFCFAVARQRRLSAEFAASPVVSEDGKLNPLLRVLEATAATVKNLGHVLKLNPTARKGSGKPKDSPAGVWAGVLE